MKYYIRNILKSFLSPTNYIRLRYLITHRKILNLKNPIRFTEKIQYRKLNCDNVYYSKFVDKLYVKEYISSNFGCEIVIPTLKVFNCLKEGDLSILNTNSFVIKTSNGGGGKCVDIFDENNTFNESKLIVKYNSLLKERFGEKVDELFYDVIEPRILIEENIGGENSSRLLDYKFHIFKSEIKFIQIDQREGDIHKMSLVDNDFNLLPYTLNKKLKPVDKTFLNKPLLFDEACILARKIANNFTYSRIDLYITNDRIFFGEITFCPSSGWSRPSSDDVDCMIGSFWDINDEVVINK